MTPKQLNSPKALKRTLNEHAYNSAEYIEISMQSFLEYLKDYTSLTLVQFAEEQGFIKHSMKMEKPVREMIDAALKQIAANRKKSAKSKTKKALEEIPDIEKESEKKTVSAKSAKKKIAKVLPTSKKYKKHMDEKFGITKKEKSKNDK